MTSIDHGGKATREDLSAGLPPLRLRLSRDCRISTGIRRLGGAGLASALLTLGLGGLLCSGAPASQAADLSVCIDKSDPSSSVGGKVSEAVANVDLTSGGLPPGLQATKPYAEVGFVLLIRAGTDAADLSSPPNGTRIAVTDPTTPNLYAAKHPNLLSDLHHNDIQILQLLIDGDRAIGRIRAEGEPKPLVEPFAPASRAQPGIDFAGATARSLFQLASATVIVGSATDETQAEKQRLDDGRDIAINGTLVFNAACAACHLQNGAGQPDVGIPRLAGADAAYLDRQLSYFRTGQRRNPLMQRFAGMLSPEQRRDVAEYYASLAVPPVPDPEPATPRDLQRGMLLSQAGKLAVAMPPCSKCHGSSERGLANVAPPLAGQSAAYIVEQLQRWSAGTMRDPTGALMRTEASSLNRAEIRSLAAFMSSLPGAAAATAAAPMGALPALYTAAQSDAGAKLFGDDCAACHGGDLKGDAGPALVGKDFASVQADFHVDDIFTIITKNMPASQPGSLPKSDYVQIMAFLLQKNGYPAGPDRLSFETAASSHTSFLWHGK